MADSDHAHHKWWSGFRDFPGAFSCKVCRWFPVWFTLSSQVFEPKGTPEPCSRWNPRSAGRILFDFNAKSKGPTSIAGINPPVCAGQKPSLLDCGEEQFMLMQQRHKLQKDTQLEAGLMAWWWHSQPCCDCLYEGFHSHRGTPKMMIYFMENPIEMDDDWGYPPPSQETSISRVVEYQSQVI